MSLRIKGMVDEEATLRNVWGQDVYTVEGGSLRGLKLSPRSGVVLSHA